MTITFHLDRAVPNDDSIFVFGSNLRGIHGAGAAKEALKKFGAELGVGVGLKGRSYAIPTKGKNIETLSLKEIRSYIDQFVQFTLDHPEMHFFVTRVGCGLAGYEDRQIAPLFKGAVNCSFAEQWRPWLV